MNKSVLSLVLLLCSCSPQQRLVRLQRHHPELFRTDTLWHRDTIITAGYRKDTLIAAIQPDTIFLKNGRLEVRYFYHQDSVYLQGRCLPDTVVRNMPMIVRSIETQETRFVWWLWIVVLGIVLVLFWRMCK
jgi:hypothetical protein